MPETPSESEAKSDALRAWYEANFEPVAGARPPKAAPPPPQPAQPPQAPQTTAPARADAPANEALDRTVAPVDPDRLQPLPAFDPTALPAPPATPAQGPAGRASSRTQPVDPNAAAQRRQMAELNRRVGQRKALRWRLFTFCLLLAGTIAGIVLIFHLIQTKFGGRIPFF